MNATQWEKLRKNISFLQRELDVEYLLVPFLIEKGVLKPGYMDEIKVIPSEEKVEHLLKALKKLPQVKNAYKYFLEGLRECDFDFTNKIADIIDETEVDSDPLVNAWVDPSHHSENVRHFLNVHFKNEQDRTTSLLQVRTGLETNNVFGDTPWSDKELIDFICDLFAGIEVQEKTDFLKKKKDIFFKNLAKIDDKDERRSSTQTSSANEDINLSTLSAAMVLSFLKKALENENMSSDSLLEMENQDINGEILLGMTEKDLHSVMPSSTFGQRRKIKTIIDEHKIKIGKEKKFERFRAFDTEVKANDCYIQGSFVDTKIQTRGTKLSPIRNFHLPGDVPDDEIKKYIVIRTAIFAAACMNERQNGTIYFGIAPDETDRRQKGQIEGIGLSLGDLDNRIMSLFFSSQEHLIKNALRNVQYVPVFKDNKFTPLPSGRHHVIEFDVVPTNALKEDEYIKINAKDIPDALETFQTVSPIFKISESGEPKLLSPEESCSNVKVPSATLQQRGQDEYEKLHPHQRPASLSRLRNHLTGGSHKMEDDIYKMLLLSTLDHSSIDVKNLHFIQNLEPEVVFDFDPRGFTEGVFKALEEQEEVLKVVTLDDFDEKKRSQKDIKSLKVELTESHFLHWVFCNGLKDMDQMDAYQWNKKKRPAFRKAFNHYLETCHQNRLLIIICLFAHNDILVEACEEILTDLPDQWILLSEQMSEAEKWRETFKNRNRVNREDLKHRCIIGLPWEQVNNGISTWCINDTSTFECQIPHSTGTLVNVEKRKLNEWNEVEIVSSLDPIYSDDETFKEQQKQVEQEFYRGGQVQWLNFFSKHVCQRKIHDELFKLVSVALEGRSHEDDNKILPVYLFHEPGAGGSTSAREILWTLRKRYRCCVMKRFTDETVEQLIEIFSFKEKANPNPLLILIDNEDEALIRVSIEQKLRSSDVSCQTFCVLLICCRTVFVPIDRRRLSMVTLKQFLYKEELSWFETRYKDLTNRYENPKSLISFNILKANFEKEFIQKTVREFVKDIDDQNEELILKFVSLINTFDLDFKPIHVSCFDVILKSLGSELRSMFNIAGGRKVSWEANVSQSFKVLLNLNDKDKQTRKTVRVFNKLTAEHILNAIIAKTGESESQVVLFLLTEDIFDECGKEMKKLQNVLGNMIKKRAAHEDNMKRDKFSPLILSVKMKEGSDQAVEIMERLFNLNNDAYTAQQIARFYIDCKMFEEAEIFAEEATRLMPSNSSLMNTYAQVFKVQLLERSQAKTGSRETLFSESEFKDLIALCMECTKLFQKEQSLSEIGYFNSDEPGYFGELESIELILKAFQKCRCFSSRSMAKKLLHNYLVKDDFTHERLQFLSPEENYFLKGLWSNSKKVIGILDDKYLQMKQEIAINPLSAKNESKDKLDTLKSNLSEFFGEHRDQIPSNLSEEDECGYRSRWLFNKKAISLSDALDLKHAQKIDELKTYYSCALKNVRSEHGTLSDFKTMLDLATVLLLDGPIPDQLRYKDIIMWTKQFYQNSWKENERPHLEAFMYFFLYNFPTEERQKFSCLAPAPDLPSVLDSWKDTFKSKRRHHTITHRETTLFFLGKGQPLKDIVYQQKLHAHVAGKGKLTWDSPRISEILRPMEGILMPEGDYIIFIDKRSKSEHEIRIKTSHKINKKVMWRNRVYFYLGFSFSGLKAYGMTSENPLK